MELARRKFIRLGNALDNFHAIQAFKAFERNIVRLADRANNRRFDALRKVDIQSRLFDGCDHSPPLAGAWRWLS